ncbi:MAG TPA: extracellular solute-binding protein [Candidatus Omnitrophota bacterium]|nr:extracellular solute-binding protein [Candidatus Omnitrophota bacterium]
MKLNNFSTFLRGGLVCLGIIFSFNDLAVAQEVVVFSGRKEALIKPVLDLFKEKTGIDVVLKAGDSAALGQQIIQEASNPSADIFIAKESGSLEYLRLKGVFEPYVSDATAKIPERFKAGDGTWIGVCGRSRAVIYNKGLIALEDVPKTLEDLTREQYKGKIAAVNASNESFIAWVSALRIYFDDTYVRNFLKKLKANEIHLLSDSHTDVRKAVGRGEYPLGLINHYYYHLQREETDPAVTNVGIVYLDQGPNDRGEIVNVSGAAIIKGAKHLKQAQQFIDFLASPQAQQLFAESNFEYPLVSGVNTHPQVLESLNCSQASALDCLHVMEVNLDRFGELLESTTDMLDEVDWH